MVIHKNRRKKKATGNGTLNRDLNYFIFKLNKVGHSAAALIFTFDDNDITIPGKKKKPMLY